MPERSSWMSSVGIGFRHQAPQVGVEASRLFVGLTARPSSSGPRTFASQRHGDCSGDFAFDRKISCSPWWS